ncbi:MAG: acetylglutamate kinase [Christensenellales bacterium]|jgi:hypothetical protein
MREIKYCNGLSCRQLQLAFTIRRLWMEHVFWTRLTIESIVFNLPDLDATSNRLLENPGDFAKILAPLYGEKTTMRFKQLFTEHLLIAAQLVNAAKAGDTAEAEKQRALWYQNAEQIAEFLASINPCWSKSEWKELLFDHLRMTENEAGFMIQGQYQDSIKGYDQIQAEALVMADVMTTGILRQFCIG